MVLSKSWIGALSLLVGSSAVLSRPSPSPQSQVVSRSDTATGKRGLCYNTANYTQAFSGDSVSWGYNWYSATDDTFNSDLEYVPMLWGNASDLTSVWSKNAKSAIASGSKHLLGFNEPDLCGSGSSCIDVDSAVSAWQTYMEPFAGDALLGSPAVTNSASPEGLTWLSNFMGNCTDCTIDFVVAHCYVTVSSSWGVADAFVYFKEFINDAIDAADGKPIWVSEYGLFGSYSTSDLESYLENTMTFLDASDHIARYAYFWDAVGTDYFMANSSSLNAIGTLYEDYDSATTVSASSSSTSTSATSSTKTSSTSTSTKSATSTKTTSTSTSTKSSTSSSTTASSTTTASSSSHTCSSNSKKRSKNRRRLANKHHKNRSLSSHQRLGLLESP